MPNKKNYCRLYYYNIDINKREGRLCPHLFTANKITNVSYIFSDYFMRTLIKENETNKPS